ncbi:MAG TPA: ABC transporter ATP-binding protein [Candidatus Saccharimonadales bacterium]|nr:ABC transporter ATP-binding protein [Candidatus Saccharimonadales bacterium]
MSSVDAQNPPLALAIRGITAGYGGPPIVTNLDMDVAKGQVVAVVGPNGAGKSTLLKAILGIARVDSGRVELNGVDVTGLPLEKLARLGIGYVPQVDDVFDGLRVRENLDMGGYLFNKAQRAERLERALAVFPQLKPRLNRYVETLSGGERKMTAIARVLMLDPSVLVLDEPTAGLSPELSKAVLETQVRALGDLGKAVLLVEQKAVAALGISDWAYMLVRGEVVMSADAKEVLAKPDMREIFLGATAPAEAGAERAR